MGVTTSGLDVNNMQQDKFAHAAKLLEPSVSETPSPNDSLIIASPDKRKSMLLTGKLSVKLRNSLTKI